MFLQLEGACSELQDVSAWSLCDIVSDGVWSVTGALVNNRWYNPRCVAEGTPLHP